MKKLITTLLYIAALSFLLPILISGQQIKDPDWELKKNMLPDGFQGQNNPFSHNSRLKPGSSFNADIGNPPAWSWVRTFGGSGGVEVNDMEVDGSGNIYILATFSDSIKITNQLLVSQGLRDVVVIKLGSFGNLLWKTQLKSSVEESIYGGSLTIGTNGKVFITGQLESQSISGGIFTKIKSGSEDFFSAGFDSNGNVQWLNIKKLSNVLNMHADNHGEFYMITTDSIFKISQAGNLIWEQRIGGIIQDFKVAGEKIWVTVVVENPGMVIADSVFTPLYFDNALVLVEIDTAGIYLRRKFFEMNYYDSYYNNAYVEADSKGNIYLSGMLPSQIVINETVVDNYTGNYVFKLDKDLELKWTINENISNNLETYYFIKNNDNRFYMYGYYYLSRPVIDSISIGDVTAFPVDNYGYYLAEIDSNGNVLQIKTCYNLNQNFAIKGAGIFYRVNILSYDVSIEKTTLDEARSWIIEIENTGGYAAFWYTMDVDDDGNLYGQGFCSGRVKILNQVINTDGIMFVKFDNDGNLKWVRVMENPDGQSSGIRVDKEGNVYAWGTFNSYIKIQGQEYDAKGGSNIYLIRFDRDGDLKFVKQFECSGFVTGVGGIDVDNKGNVLLCGIFTDTLRFSGYELKSFDGAYDGFLVKLNANGNVLWARRYGGKSSDWARSVVADSLGNIYLTGAYRDSIAFDNIGFKKTILGFDLFVAKLDPNGKAIWARTGGPENRYIRGHSITIFKDHVYIQGIAWNPGPYKFGNISLTSEFISNTFLADYDTDGNLRWVKLIKANDYGWPMYKIETDAKNNIYVGGMFYDTLVVESNLIPGSGGTDYYVAKYNNKGELQWLKTSEQSSTADIELFSLAVFDEDVVLVGGRITNGAVQVGSQKIVTASTESFAGLIGKAIIGCEIDLQLAIINTDPGDSTGSAKVTITGGTAPYYIRWSRGQEETDQITKQPAGIYQVYIEDARGCVQYREFAINDLNGPVISVDSIHDASCFGYADGFIHISVTGGTPPYQYFWSNGMKIQDVGQMEAAPYEVQVKDANGLVAYQGFTISEPKQLDITFDLYRASCNGGINGRIDLFVSGGTKPYEYEWSNGWTTDDLTGIPAGKYKITVTDKNKCVSVNDIALSEEGAPVVELDSIIPANCNQTDGEISVRVLAAIGPVTYQWSNGATAPSITGVKAGDYFVNVTNQLGCKAVYKVTVGNRLPAENPICLVTVDTAIGSNLIVWEKIASTEVYHIFRETSKKDVYLLAGSVPGDELSVFTDSVANPRIRSYRYKIAAVDECGNASILSTLHKTVHLTINLGQDGSINLFWDDYVGENVESFEVWRYSTVFGWQLLETLPSNLFSYSDFNVPPGKVFYNVRVPLPDPCYPAGYTKADTGPYSHSMSNIEDNRLQTFSDDPLSYQAIFLYPNPTRGKVLLWKEKGLPEEFEIRITDISGRMVMNKKLTGIMDDRIELDLTGQSPGSYLIKLISGSEIYHNKLVIQ